MLAHEIIQSATSDVLQKQVTKEKPGKTNLGAGEHMSGLRHYFKDSFHWIDEY